MFTDLDPAAFDKLRDFLYSYVAMRPCIVCKATPVQVAHLMGFPSRKSNEPEPRRKGLSLLRIVPLCPEHHLNHRSSIHNIGEWAFGREWGYGDQWVYDWSQLVLLEAFAAYIENDIEGTS